MTSDERPQRVSDDARRHLQHRIDRIQAPSLQPWRRNLRERDGEVPHNVVVDVGWGRLLFGHTFDDSEAIARILRLEADNLRDIAIYVPDPHVVVSLAPQEIFLDPSHGYRLYFEDYRAPTSGSPAFTVRKLQTPEDAERVNDVYARRHMVTFDPSFIHKGRMRPELTYLVAQDNRTGAIIGTVTGVDHVQAFQDPENGCSLWALAVDPQTSHPGVGKALVVHLIEHYLARGRVHMDLSVMHDNKQAIRLYESLGFSRVPVFVVKNRNRINEPLFVGEEPADQMNPYAQIITREARRRGIFVSVLDQEQAFFSLTFGGRTIVCRESLTELTSAIAMSRCDDKRVTHRVLAEAGLRLPAQLTLSDEVDALKFLETHGRIVVKPARGEQGAGVSVGIGTAEELRAAVELARAGGSEVILEQMVEGHDLRIVVIDFRVVAAAIRRPPEVVGDGERTISALITVQSQRRAAATQGESSIPVDEETRRCVAAAGFSLDDVPSAGQAIQVRKAANLHTGGTIHDITDELHPHLVEVAKRAAEVIDIPVVGLDLMVPSARSADYWIIEANERPGLANHEPQPIAERFIDLLFPLTVTNSST